MSDEAARAADDERQEDVDDAATSSGAADGEGEERAAEEESGDEERNSEERPRDERDDRGEETAEDEDEDDEDPGVVEAFLRWTRGEPLSKSMAALFGLFLPTVTLVVNMLRVRAFTIDDAFISYRYARNFSRGLGLVYNPPERIEGYTNFLWTVILAIGIKLGIDPDALAKVLGGAAAIGTLALTYKISSRLLPYRTLPCVATWLLASTIVTTGYSVFGLETSTFVFLILLGTEMFLAEEQPGAEAKKPWSGLVFALAGLTRPEAPAYIGILMLFLGLKFFSKKNILRGVIFVVPLALHLLWRHSYYGAWVPNTFTAKTGNSEGQLHAGLDYLVNYLKMAGPAMGIAVAGVAVGIFDRARRRWILAVTALTSFVAIYVVIVGGDWMPFFRFMAPFEPFAFLLVDVGARYLVDRRDKVITFTLALLAIVCVYQRAAELRIAQKQFLEKEKRFWDTAAGGTAEWFLTNNPPPGTLALGDIGEVGYKTDRPILDLLGLVDPVIAKLPGGYTQKLGPGFSERFFGVMPEYALIISSNIDCQHPSVPGSQVLYRDRRFLQSYEIGGKIPLDGGFAWCIYKRKNLPR